MTRASSIFLIKCAFLVCLACLPARAQAPEFLPEVDTHLKLNSSFRAYLEAKDDRDGGDPPQFAIGPSVQLYVKPLIKLKNVTTFDLDDTRSRFLVLETGYRYITAPRAAPENRMLTAVTFNLPVGAGIRLSDRNRADLDWKNGIFNWRYRNKLSLGRTFAIRSYHFIPYVAAEPYYESPYGKWSTTALYVGSMFPVGKHVQFKLLLRAREQHRQTPKPAGECGGAGSLRLLFPGKVVNLAVLSAGPWAVTFDNYPLLRLMPTLPCPLVCGRPQSATSVRFVVQKEVWASEGRHLTTRKIKDLSTERGPFVSTLLED
jgi:hypothetical protein